MSTATADRSDRRGFRQSFRSWLLALAAPLLLVAVPAAPALAQDEAMIEVTDMAGRTVQVRHGVQRAILAEGRLFYGTVVLDREKPFAQLAAIADDLKAFDPDTWNRYLERFPEAADVPMVGALAGTDFSVERAIDLDADLVIASLGFYAKAMETGIVDNLAKAGIPVIFIDFRERPLQNTVPSMMLLGRVFAKEAQAQAFVDFYTQKMQEVYTRLATVKEADRPVVFIERAAGLDPNACCMTFGPVNFGEFVGIAGARNWGSTFFAGLGGQVNPEQIIVDDPAYLLLTGANWSNSNPGNTAVWLGYETDPNKAEEQLRGLMNRPGFPELSAVKNHKVMAIYHQFYQSPYHFVAVQALAKWINPDLFQDVDPWATFTELHERFLPIKPSGVFWIELK